MSATTLRPTGRERRLARYLDARRETGLVDALLELKGTRFGSRYECVSLYAVGGEGAVFLARDLFRESPLRVAKIALLPFHRPFELDAATVAKRRAVIEMEARYLAGTGGTFLPKHLGTYDFKNPLLDPARGGVFAEPGCAIVMERLPGHDLDRWLARAHRSELPAELLRPTLDGVSAMLLQAVGELLDRGLLYADLRPANLRMLSQPRRHARLLDAGSLVTVYDRSGRFPHVPAYLPPPLLAARGGAEPIQPSPAVQAVMAGRTLYEVATGCIPHPGEEIDEDLLRTSAVSPRTAELIAGLARGAFADARDALASLSTPATTSATTPASTVVPVPSPGPPSPGPPSLARPSPTPPPRVPTPPVTPRIVGPGLGHAPWVRKALRRRKRSAHRTPLQDGLRALRKLTRIGAQGPPRAPAVAPVASGPPDGALIEVPQSRLVLPQAVDEAALRTGLTSPAVADAIGRLARGEFRSGSDALRYARAAQLSHWDWALPAPAKPSTEEPEKAPLPGPPRKHARTRATPAAGVPAGPVPRIASRAAAPRPLPVPEHRPPSLAQRIRRGLRRLIGLDRA